MDNHYGNVIWTNHALDRLKERKISQGDAWATWRKPQASRYSESRGGWVYSRQYGNTTIEVVAKQNEKGEWLILSVWSRQGKIYNKKVSFFTHLLRLFGFR
jgi:Domain of unknown function (DUF4258)